MNKKQIFSVSSLVVAVIVFSGLFVVPVLADHSWGSFHWGRTANSFTLKLGDNVSSAWDSYLRASSSDWSQSSVLDTAVVSGRTSPRICKPTLGQVEVCNNKYGRNGWLGVASIWLNSSGHITQSTVKVNDSYFSSKPYNTTVWKTSVMCQEIGHTFGLDHQDEDFYNLPLGSCMDYSADPTLNQRPNQHDYEQLETIYNSHFDSTDTVGQTMLSRLERLVGTGVEQVNVGEEGDEEWGRPVRKSKDKRNSLYEKELGRGEKVYTFVIWADPRHK